VGIQCVSCVAEGARSVRAPTSRFGAPLRRDTRPVVTVALIGLCLLVYVGQLASEAVTERLMFVPVLAQAEAWRFVTVAFVHSPDSFLHIAFNMYALWITGSYLEPLLGRLRFLALYLVSAIGGSVGYLLLARVPEVVGERAGWVIPTVGASGAVFGLFAAVFVLNRHLGRESAGILLVLVINTVIGFVIPYIAWQAHLGGALTGAAIALVLALTSPAARDATSRSRRRLQWPAMAGVLAVLAAAAVWRLASVDDALLRMLYS
jgi:membrane associated rhomboid family serine protease